MHGDLLVVLLILVLGCAAFLMGVAYFLGWLFAGLGRGVLRVFGYRPRAANRSRPPPGARAVICPRADCRKVEYRPARYCSRCGERL